MTDQANGPASDAMTIARLAALTSGDYDRVRRKEADQLGWRVETLDAEVAKARRVASTIEGSRPLDVMAPPAAVLIATDNYLQAEDAISNWIRERCKRIPYGGTEWSILYSDWCTVVEGGGRGPRLSETFQPSFGGQGLCQRHQGATRHIPRDRARSPWADPLNGRA